MSLHIKHKSLIGGLAFTSVVFAALFLVSFLQLQNQPGEEEREESSVRYLRSEEAVIIEPTFIQSEERNLENESPEEIIVETVEETEEAIETSQPEVLTVEPVLFEYIEIIDSCDYNFEGDCLNVRSGPGTDFPVVNRLRTGAILKVGGEVERNEEIWYKIVFDEWLRYPERVTSDWYVSADFVEVLLDEGVLNLKDEKEAKTQKRIEVSRSEQKLRAYQGDELFMEEDISTGLELTPTPRGEFTIFRKTPSRYMQGPIPGISSRFWDLPGVPWNLYFTHQGAIIHGAYWHDDFGRAASAGCVNMETDTARKLYNWAEIGTKVIVRD